MQAFSIIINDNENKAYLNVRFKALRPLHSIAGTSFPIVFVSEVNESGAFSIKSRDREYSIMVVQQKTSQKCFIFHFLSNSFQTSGPVFTLLFFFHRQVHIVCTPTGSNYFLGFRTGMREAIIEKSKKF